MYILSETKLLPALNKIDGRIVYDSVGNLFVTDKTSYRKIPRLSLLHKDEIVEDLTDMQYNLFFKIAKYHVNTQGYQKV
jgi:hypothetical protein